MIECFTHVEGSGRCSRLSRNYQWELVSEFLISPLSLPNANVTVCVILSLMCVLGKSKVCQSQSSPNVEQGALHAVLQ